MFSKKLKNALGFCLGFILAGASVCYPQTPTTIRGEMDDSATVNAVEGGQYTARITPLRGLHANLRNASGAEIGTASDPVNVEGTLTCNLGTVAGLATESTLAAINAKLVSGTDIGDVTINNASGGSAVNVQDGGNSLTVDAPVGTPVNVRIGDATNTATIRDLGSNDSLNVAIVDGSGAQITSFGGGVQYTEGDTDASITGTAGMMEGAANTLVPFQGTTADGLLVNLGANNDVTVASLPLPTGASTSANQSTMIGHVDGIEALLTTIDADTSSIAAEDFATQTTLAAINAKLVTGTDIGDVTINNASGASAVNIQDGGNSITVDNSVLSVVGGGTEATAQRVTIANDSTGVLSVDDNGASLTVDGTVAATQSGTWNINNISGTVSLPTGAATAANQSTEITALQIIDNLPNTLGSTTSGQSGALALGAVTTAAPSYTTGQSNALSLNTSGGLRVDGSGVTQPVSGTVTANAGTNLNTSALALESGGNLAASATSLSVLDDWDETDRAKVNTIVGQAGVAAGAGAVGATTQRMTLASDDPAVTALQVIDNIVSGSGVNVSQLNGVAVTMGNGASGTGVQRVTIADDSTGQIKNIAKEDSGTTLTALNTTYNNTTTSADSADVSCAGYRFVDLVITLDSTNTPTDLTISAWAKDGGNYFKYSEGYWGRFVFDYTAIATAQNIWARFPCPASGTFRVEIDCTGTDASNTFTVTNAKVYNKS